MNNGSNSVLLEHILYIAPDKGSIVRFFFFTPKHTFRVFIALALGGDFGEYQVFWCTNKKYDLK